MLNMYKHRTSGVDRGGLLVFVQILSLKSLLIIARVLLQLYENWHSRQKEISLALLAENLTFIFFFFLTLVSRSFARVVEKEK